VPESMHAKFNMKMR